MAGRDAPPNAEDARECVVCDPHQEERRETEHLGVAVDLPVVDGTSPPAAIRIRLIIPVVAPRVSVNPSAPMMKCGEKRLGAFDGRPREGSRRR